MNLHEGSLLQGGRYRIEKVLGQGGFGITYSGYQTNLEAKVAIKEFFMKDLCNRDATTSQVSVGSVGSRETVETFRQKFLKEARNIFRLKHKHIISVIDVFEENGTAYYVMEHVGGGSLAGKVLHGALPEEDAVRYTRQVADALAFVHSKRMMHLDVKPANILLDDNDNAVLIDFGLAKQYDTEGHQTSSTPVGISHGYAPLEQYKRGGVSTFSPATDIYSLGATLFKLVTGITPPEASDVNDEGLPVLPQEISAPVRRAIEAAMQPRRKDRPQSVAEFLELLKGSKDLKDPKAFKYLNEETKAPEEELIDDADVEVTVLPDKRVQRTDNRVQRVNVKAVEIDNEETRVVEKETARETVKNSELVSAEPGKLSTFLRLFKIFLLSYLAGEAIMAMWSYEYDDNPWLEIEKTVFLIFSFLLIYVAKEKKTRTGTIILSLVLFLDLCWYVVVVGTPLVTMIGWAVYLICVYICSLAYSIFFIYSIARILSNTGFVKGTVTQFIICYAVLSFLLLYNIIVRISLDLNDYYYIFDRSYHIYILVNIVLSIYLFAIICLKFRAGMEFKCPVRTMLLMSMRVISVLMLFLMLLQQAYYYVDWRHYRFFISDFYESFTIVYISIAINLAISFIKPVKWLNRIVSVATLVFILFRGWIIIIISDLEIAWPCVLSILLAVAGVVLSFLPQKSKV